MTSGTRSKTNWIASSVILVLVAIAVFLLVPKKADRDQESPLQPPQLTKVVLAQNPVPHSALPIVAKARGFFQEFGLEVEVTEFTTGKLCFDAMLGGAAHFSTVAETPIMYAGFSQQPAYVVATIEKSPLSVKVIARKDKGVTAPEDLRGKPVGTFKGGSAEYFLSQFLRKYGMTFTDVTMTYMQPPELVAAAIRGDLAAIAMWEPHIYSAQKGIGDDAVVFTGEDIYTETFHVAVMKEYADTNGETVVAFLRALAKAEDFLKSNESEAKKIILTATSIDEEVLDHIWPNFSFDLELRQEILDLIEKEAKYAVESGARPEGTPIPDYRTMFEPSFLKAVRPDAVDLRE